MPTTKAVRGSLLHQDVRRKAFAEASRFRGEFYECLTARRHELFELTDALLCVEGPVVDVSPWLRSDTPCSADRLFCHVYGRAKSASQFIPGWPYSFVAVLKPGATSWTGILDVVRLGPEDNATAVTAVQPRGRGRAAHRGRPVDAGRPGHHHRHGRRLRHHPSGPGTTGSARRPGRADPQRPRDASAETTQDARRQQPTAPARAGVPLRQARDLARTSHHHGHRHHEPQKGRDPGVGPVPPATDPSLGPAGARRRTPPRRRHPGPATCRAPLEGTRDLAGVVVVREDRRRPDGHEPVVAGIPQEIRPGAHLPFRKTDTEQASRPPKGTTSEDTREDAPNCRQNPVPARAVAAHQERRGPVVRVHHEVDRPERHEVVGNALDVPPTDARAPRGLEGP